MNAQYIGLLVLYLAVLLALAPFLALHPHRHGGRAVPLDRLGPSAGTRHLPAVRHRSASRDGLEALRAGGAGLQHPRHHRRLRPATPAGHAAAEPGRHGPGIARFRAEHRHQLRRQHQLAGLRRRIDHELPDADAGAHGAELRVRRDRHRRAVRVDPRAGAPLQRHAGQLLDRHGPQHAVCAAAAVADPGPGAGQPGRDPELQPLCRGADRRGAALRPAARGRAGQPVLDAAGQPVTDPAVTQTQTLAMGPVASQEAIAAGHQRRRLLQRQLGPSL